MRDATRLRRALLLGLSALSACAAADPSAAAGRHAVAVAGARQLPTGIYGDFLDGQFAVSESDMDRAAEAFERALALDPGNQDLTQQAFVSALMAGHPEALRYARKLPDNQVAQLLLADADARAGNWDAAENKYHALSHQGLTQLLQPLLVAWAQLGGGHVDAALATLRPYVDGQRFRGVYALHAALIADIGGRAADAARLYHTAQTEYGGTNLRLAEALASWQYRQGHKQDAEETLRALTEGGDDLSLSQTLLVAAAAHRPVNKATDGIAEAYLALAAALRQQDATDFSLLLLRLALDLRPDFTPARLLLADIMQSSKHYDNALAALAPVPADDPLAPVVRLRRAALEDQLGRTEEATQQLEQLARDFPDSPLPYAQLADTLRAKNRFPEAIQAYDRAIARQGEQPRRSAWPLFYARGIAYERSHQWPKAETDFQRALELAPDQPSVLNYLGYSWADQGSHLARAKQMIERAAELRPNDGAIVDSLGWVEFRQGNGREAVKTLERAVELQPEDASINGHLGDAYAAVGRKREAEFQWRRALTLNPEPDEAARLEAKLHEAAVTPEGAATAEHQP
jgi:tetratricopeptide (TPR) repeat protein